MLDIPLRHRFQVRTYSSVSLCVLFRHRNAKKTRNNLGGPDTLKSLRSRKIWVTSVIIPCRKRALYVELPRMLNIYLTSPIHFHTAALDRLPVSVFQDGEYLVCGAIDGITEDAVIIGGFHYVRSACTFVTFMFLVTEYGVPSEFDEMSPADVDYVTEEYGGKLNVLVAYGGKRYVPHMTVDDAGRMLFPRENYAILSSKLRRP